MMTTMNAVEMAQIAVLSTDSTIIVLELVNGGTSSRWAQQFPSLTNEQTNVLDETTFLSFESQTEAYKTFERLCLDCAENGTGGLIEGTMTLVTAPFGEDDGVETVAWELDETTRPVFGIRSWSREVIAERL